MGRYTMPNDTTIRQIVFASQVPIKIQCEPMLAMASKPLLSFMNMLKSGEVAAAADMLPQLIAFLAHLMRELFFRIAK
jgi:hypothetical protein